MEHPDDEGRVGVEHPEKHEDEEAVARHEELKKSVEAKMVLRQNNLNPERPGCSECCVICEIISSIIFLTPFVFFLPFLIPFSFFVVFMNLYAICSLLHQRYKDFSPSLVQGLVKVFFPGKVIEDVDVDRNARAMKKRSTSKLLLEVYFVGVLEDTGIFVNIVKDLTSVEHLKGHCDRSLLSNYMMSYIIYTMIFVVLVKDSTPDADETQTTAQEIVDGAADAGALQEDRNDKGKDKDEKDKEKTKEKSK
ncbi:hypothetical protein K7X08_002743 [Anisodus acutangulus]|uniref:Uncharacterized protein n=1 Tax=Anisodus acutangulus TaxID=402998 RepID=A0A9Q1MFR2_9SOLA|nr:hypothetical protein K7X08_002743 [Anisodus acutangulus]